ncbi:MAG: hypothetical protein U0Q18_07105 [Bryobacteraceae bacterium]
MLIALAMKLSMVLFIAYVCASTLLAQPVTLSPEARQMAAILDITDVLRDFDALRSVTLSADTKLRRLMLREEITEAVIQASLDTDAAIASIQREQAQIQAATDSLSARRDRLVNLTTAAATIAGSGIGIAASAMQFNDRTAYAGDGVSIASGAAATILSLMAMRLQRGGRTHIEISPNMLARVFDRPSEAASVWPAGVWAYLNAAPASGVRNQPRLQSLIEQWTREGRIPSASPDTKIAFLTSSFAENRRLSLSDLSDRAAMLGDLRAQIALMKRDIAVLLGYLRQFGW